MDRVYQTTLAALCAGAVCYCGACGHGARPDASAPPQPDDSIRLDPRLGQAAPKVRLAWHAYGEAVADVRDAAGGVSPGVVRFLGEVAGREALAERWQVLTRLGFGAHDAYLEALSAAVGAGFSREYTLAYLSAPGWRAPSEAMRDLRLPEFIAWASRNLEEHVPRTLARIAMGDASLELDVPGADLCAVSLDTLGAEPRCSLVGEELAQQLHGWERVLDRAGPLPIAARSHAELIETMMLAERDHRLQLYGVVWVSPRIADAYLLAAQCAMEQGAYDHAQLLLRRLLTLNPVHEDAARELVLALVLAKEWRTALAAIEEALTFTVDRRAIAVLRRAEGYVLAAQGDLPGARRAVREALSQRPRDPALAAALADLDEPDRYEPPAAMALLRWCHATCREGTP